MNGFSNNGFSLIELMVVIAIVGVLSAVAVPSYKNYRYKANLGQAYASAFEIINRGYRYYDQNGVLPFIPGLGLTQASNTVLTTNFNLPITAISPYLFTVQVNPHDASTYLGLYGCAIGAWYFNLSPSEPNVVTSTTGFLPLSFETYNVKGTFYTICTYNSDVDLLPNCYNLSDAAQSSAAIAKGSAYRACTTG